MKIEFKNRGSREYFDEVLYIATYINKFIKKPNRKVHRLTKFYRNYLIFIIIYLLLMIWFYIKYKDLLFIFLLGFMSLLLVFVLKGLIITNKRIKYYLEEKNNKSIEFDTKTIKYIDKIKTLSIDWKDVKNIIINNYSIIFLPVNNTLPVIAIDKQYKDQVDEVIKKYSKEELIINNK